MVSWGLDFEFGLGLPFGLELGLKFGLSLKLGFGLGERFLFVHWRAIKLYLFQMIGFYGLLTGNIAWTEVLPFPITRARLMYWSANLRAKPVYRIGSPAAKISATRYYARQFIFGASTSTLAFYLLSVTCV